MNVSDMRKKTVAELDAQVSKQREKLAATRQERVTKGDPQMKTLQSLKKEIAQLLTIKREMENGTVAAKPAGEKDA